jgi:hypothetical protein
LGQVAALERSAHRVIRRSGSTEWFDDFPGLGERVTTLLEGKDGTTTMTVTILAASKEVRDAVMASAMEHGAAESYDRLAALLEAASATA